MICSICFNAPAEEGKSVCRPCLEHARTHCPEHGCKLEPDGECKGCTSPYSEEDYAIIHRDVGDK